MRLSHLLVDQSFSLYSPQLPAIVKQGQNQIALRLNGRTLEDDQQRHQCVGKQEQYGE